jgi:hypothetical protein
VHVSPCTRAYCSELCRYIPCHSILFILSGLACILFVRSESEACVLSCWNTSEMHCAQGLCGNSFSNEGLTGADR